MYENGVLTVFGVGMPPLEYLGVSKEAFVDVNFFGGQYNSADEGSLVRAEMDTNDVIMYFFSDVFLDDPRVSGFTCVYVCMIWYTCAWHAC
jgi:hypothetical protein